MSRATQVPSSSIFCFIYGIVTLYDQPFQIVRLQKTSHDNGPTTPADMSAGLGSSLFARRYWGNRVFFLFPGYLDVSVPQVLPSLDYVFIQELSGITLIGLPHSEISGSKLVYSSPKLIAVSHVLHRLLMPRHSPFALSSLALFYKYYQLKTLYLRCRA